MSDDLDAQLIEAHARDDKDELVRLYTQAADTAEAQGDENAACFFLTHAFVFALEIDAPEARQLNDRLVSYGRAHPLED